MADYPTDAKIWEIPKANQTVPNQPLRCLGGILSDQNKENSQPNQTKTNQIKPCYLDGKLSDAARWLSRRAAAAAPDFNCCLLSKSKSG